MGVAVAFSFGQSWMSGVIVKLMSSVVKLVGKCVSLAMVYFVAECWVLYNPAKPPTGSQHVPALCLAFKNSKRNASLGVERNFHYCSIISRTLTLAFFAYVARKDLTDVRGVHSVT